MGTICDNHQQTPAAAFLRSSIQYNTKSYRMHKYLLNSLQVSHTALETETNNLMADLNEFSSTNVNDAGAAKHIADEQFDFDVTNFQQSSEATATTVTPIQKKIQNAPSSSKEEKEGSSSPSESEERDMPKVRASVKETGQEPIK